MCGNSYTRKTVHNKKLNTVKISFELNLNDSSNIFSELSNRTVGFFMSSLMKGTAILTIGLFLSKLLGLIYIFPFYAIVGEENIGLYNYAYIPYNIMLSIAIAGLPIAVSKFVSKYNALGDYDAGREISAKAKLLGQIIAACIVVFVGGIQIQNINLPFGAGELEFGWIGIPLTIIWIVGITNAINLIDGLDGLAAGVSTIALITLSVMAMLMGNGIVIAMGASER